MTYKLSWHNPQLFLSSHLLLLWSFNVRTHSAALQTRFAILQFLCQEPRQHIKKQGHHFADKGPYSQNYGFPDSHVQMWKLDHEEGWVLKNWCFWAMVLEKTLESPLDSKEIKPVNPKKKSTLNIHWKYWCWSWSSNTLATWCEELALGNDHDTGKDLGQEEKGATEDEMVGWNHRFNGCEFEQTQGGSEGQGHLACKVRYNFVTKQEQMSCSITY